ncbi:MAG: hypothetical protein J6R79_01855 [Bacteroidaceae bacterium]|nr:hypothetical protein [Bacteroidaceae bacterium]
MKYKLTTLLCLLLNVFMTTPLWADDYVDISVSPTSNTNEWKLDISLENPESSNYTAFQMDLVLPEGTLVNDASFGGSSRLTNHTLTTNLQNDGMWRVAAYSLNNTAITGNSGTLFSVLVTFNPVQGTNALVTSLTNVRFSKRNGVESPFSDDSYTLSCLTLTEGINFENEESTLFNVVNYVRTLPNQKWNALYLPVEIPVSALSENYDVAYFNNMHAYDRDNNGVIEKMDMEVIRIAQGTLHANHPYFIRAKNDAAKKMNLLLSNAVVQNTDAANCTSITTSSAYMNFELTGIYTRHYANELAGCYAITGTGSWAPIAEGSYLNPFRFYLKMTNRNGSPVKADKVAQTIHIYLKGEEGTTGIEETTVNTQESTVIYDLQGRRVTHPTKGMYIVNGKKVILK